jgi:hypothetical protein
MNTGRSNASTIFNESLVREKDHSKKDEKEQADIEKEFENEDYESDDHASSRSIAQSTSCPSLNRETDIPSEHVISKHNAEVICVSVIT